MSSGKATLMCQTLLLLPMALQKSGDYQGEGGLAPGTARAGPWGCAESTSLCICCGGSSVQVSGRSCWIHLFSSASVLITSQISLCRRVCWIVP